MNCSGRGRTTGGEAARGPGGRTQLAGEAAATVLDCGGAEGPLSPRLLALVDVLSPNETELHSLTGAQAAQLLR